MKLTILTITLLSSLFFTGFAIAACASCTQESTCGSSPGYSCGCTDPYCGGSQIRNNQSTCISANTCCTAFGNDGAFSEY